jgi:hypothetical protein
LFIKQEPQLSDGELPNGIEYVSNSGKEEEMEAENTTALSIKLEERDSSIKGKTQVSNEKDVTEV